MIPNILNFAKIGGSDVAPILGLSPFKAPVDVWQRIALGIKTDLPAHALERVKWGQRLELPTGQAWIEENEPARAHEWKPGKSIEPDDPNWIRYTVDFERPGAILEVKTTSAFSRSNWGQPGSDEIPIHYATQVAWYLYHERQRIRRLNVPNLAPPDRCFVAVLIGGQELLSYTVFADDEFGAAIFERVAAWRRRYVLPKIPPPIDGSDGCRNYLAGKFRKQSGIIRPTENGEAEALGEWIALEMKKKAIEKQIKTLENKIINSIAGDEGIEALDDAGKIRATFKRPKSSSRVNWKTAREAIAQELDAARFAEILENHTTQTQPVKRLSIKRIKA